MRDKATTLSQLPIGAEATIQEVRESSFACTLLTMGVLPNVIVKVLRKSPLGQSLYVKVGDNFVAMRKSEGNSILVKSI